MAKTLIFTATYNESKNISELIDNILELKEDVDLLIIDDNSPDNTSLIIEKYIHLLVSERFSCRRANRLS